MSLNADLSAIGAWELMYRRKISINRRSQRQPYIEPIEIPLLTNARIFIVSTFSLKGRPTWYRAGYLSRQMEGLSIDDTVVFEGFGQIPRVPADFGSELIRLNLTQIVVFPEVSGDFSLRFEAMPWIYDLNLGIWEFKGNQSDSTEDLIEAMQAKLEVIEFKIDQL